MEIGQMIKLKSLLNEANYNLKEEESEAAQEAHKLGLIAKGWGRWADPQTGEIVAKTVQGKLVKVKAKESPSRMQKMMTRLGLGKKPNSPQKAGKTFYTPSGFDPEEVEDEFGRDMGQHNYLDTIAGADRQILGPNGQYPGGSTNYYDRYGANKFKGSKIPDYGEPEEKDIVAPDGSYPGRYHSDYDRKGVNHFKGSKMPDYGEPEEKDIIEPKHFGKGKKSKIENKNATVPRSRK